MKSMVNKVEEFTNNKVKFIYHWKTRKLKSLFPLKDRIKHKANIIYKGICSCKESYIGETKRNAEIRWKEHCSNNDKKSEVAEHLLTNPGHTINWKVVQKPQQLRTNCATIYHTYICYQKSINLIKQDRNIPNFQKIESILLTNAQLDENGLNVNK